jgi:NAD+ synthase
MLFMSKNLKILAAQLNPVVGDIEGNLALARGALAEGKARGADLVVLSEHFMLGYPAEDLVLKPSAVELSMAAVQRLARDTEGAPAMVVGAPWRDGGKLYNSALFLEGGRITARHDKRELPNYGVFDEKRHYQPGEGPAVVVDFKGVRLGLAICEDIWFEPVTRAAKAAGAELMLVPNASPWRRAIQEERAAAFDRWADLGLPYLFVNQMGGQDELVFDGASFATNSTHAERCGLVGQFETGYALVEFDPSTKQFVGLGKGCGIPRGDARPRRLCAQEPVSRRCAWHVRRHRLGDHGGHRRRRAGAGQGLVRDDAVEVYEHGQPRRREGLRRSARLQV